MKKNKISIVSKFSSYGGISKMMVHLANGMVAANADVDLVIAGGKVPFPEMIDPRVQLIDLGIKHVYQAIFPLISYLNKSSPDVVLATRHRNITISLIAHHLAKGRKSRKLAIRLSGNLSSAIAGKNALGKWMHKFHIRTLYSKADSVIAVSKGVADDFCHLADLPISKVTVVHNPTIPENIHTLSQKFIDHSWFVTRTIPIVIGVGRFTKRKDFATLIKAFALLRQKLSCRLVLVGDGQEKENYLSLAKSLGVLQDIYFPGVTSNPYAYMAKANVLALTSKAAEGSPNVIKEALALGLPVVSTDCPSGPREILDNGKFGELVPMQDHYSLAVALEKTIKSPPPPAFLKSAVEAYTIDSSTQEYMKAFGLA